MPTGKVKWYDVEKGFGFNTMQGEFVFADGRVFSGTQALDLRMIDALGGFDFKRILSIADALPMPLALIDRRPGVTVRASRSGTGTHRTW